MYFTCALISFDTAFDIFIAEVPLSSSDCSSSAWSSAHAHTLTVHSCTTKRRGWKCAWISWHPVGDLVSSFAYANSGIRAGHVALHARSEVLCPRERVIVVSSRLLSSKHVGTIDNIAWNLTGPQGLRYQATSTKLSCSDFFPVVKYLIWLCRLHFLCFLIN